MDIIVHGYYRYTDIMFSWHEVVTADNTAERGALKGVLRKDTLVSPECPLRIEGDNGFRLYVVTLEGGDMKLTFSSAQIEYIRYWLYTMQYTKELLPLPSSAYLIRENVCKAVSTVIIRDQKGFSKALKDVDQNNKRLKHGRDDRLVGLRTSFELVRKLWSQNIGTWWAVDFEEWEMDHSITLEFGWSTCQWKDSQLIEEAGHMILQDRLGFWNGKYVPDNREKYRTNDSRRVTTTDFKIKLSEMTSRYRSAGPLFIVVHGGHGDISTLERSGAPIDEHTFELPEKENPPNNAIYVIDTALLFGALEGESRDTRKLDFICKLLGVGGENFHNAGNDAYYTMKAAQAMAGGPHLDQQREERWPNSTGKTSTGAQTNKVDWDKWEVEQESEDDLEGMFPPGQGEMVIDE